jgi:ABC-type glycerol-3-phosphate transport system substrate-binding protein
MKKLLCLLLAVTMLIGISACTTGDKKEPVNDGKIVSNDQGSANDEGSTDGKEAANMKKFTLNVNVNQKSDTEIALIETALKKYYEKYPNATVNVNYGVDTSNMSDYATKLLSQFASGEKIDVLWIAVEGVAYLAGNDIIVPIDEYITSNEEVKKRLDDIAPAVLACLQYNKKQYGLPLSWNNTVVMFNTKMFAEAGIGYNPDWTWSDFEQALIKLKKEDPVKGTTYGFMFNMTLSDYLPFLAANGSFDMNEEWTESWWDKPETIETFEYIHGLIKKGLVAYPEANVWASSFFSAERIAAQMGGPWAISMFKSMDFSDFDYLSVPSNKGIKACAVGGDGYCLTSACENPDEALELMNLLTNDDIQMMIAELGTGNPSTMSASYSDVFKSHAPHAILNYDLVLDKNAVSRVITSPVFRSDIETAFTNYWTQALAGEITVKEMCNAMHETVNAKLAAQK